MNVKNRFAITVAVCALASFAHTASAENLQKNEPYTPFFIPAVYAIDNDWSKQDYDFQTPVAAPIETDIEGVTISEAPANEISESTNSYASKDKGDFVDDLMEKIPYSKQLKYTWNVVDGDVDLYFEDLRVDRRNKGVSYTMETLPLVGEMEGSEIRAEVGDDNKITFKSDYMPLMGRVDGFQFKASTGTDDSTVSFKYKTAIDW